MNPIKKLLTGWQYNIGATIFRLHDNTFGFGPDKAKITQTEGVAVMEFMDHPSWKKPDDKYIFLDVEHGPHVFLYEIAPGVYVPMQVVCDFGELSPEKMSAYKRTVQKAKRICDPVDRQIAKIVESVEGEVMELTQEQKEKIEELQTEEYKQMVEKGNEAYSKLREIKAYFYIPKEEAKHWFGRKMEATWTKYPSISDKLKKFAVPIGIIVILVVMFFVFGPKIKEFFAGLRGI